jgi:hypothetical protein
MEPLWDWLIRMGALPILLPVLESVLCGQQPNSTPVDNPAISANQKLLEPQDV